MDGNRNSELEVTGKPEAKTSSESLDEWFSAFSVTRIDQTFASFFSKSIIKTFHAKENENKQSKETHRLTFAISRKYEF